MYKFNKGVGLGGHYGGVNNIANETIENILGSNTGRYYFVGARAQFQNNFKG